MKFSGIHPSRLLVIILGASSYDESPKLADGPPFYNSASDFRNYLRNNLGVPRENIKWLFDNSQSPSDQLDEIARFLSIRKSVLDGLKTPAEDLLLYYVGHGIFAHEKYCLAIRKTTEGNEALSSIRGSDLATAIKDNARFLRRYLILDCCFSAAIYAEFQTGPGRVATAQFAKELPLKGTSLLCSSNPDDPSLVSSMVKRTMFSDALICALTEGHPTLGETISFSELGELVKENLRSKYAGEWARPEVHSPDQREGDVADLPMFPNPAHKIEVESEQLEKRRRAEERVEREREEHERVAREEQEREERARLAREEHEREERARLAREKQEQEERARLAREKQEQEERARLIRDKWEQEDREWMARKKQEQLESERKGEDLSFLYKLPTNPTDKNQPWLANLFLIGDFVAASDGHALFAVRLHSKSSIQAKAAPEKAAQVVLGWFSSGRSKEITIHRKELVDFMSATTVSDQVDPVRVAGVILNRRLLRPYLEHIKVDVLRVWGIVGTYPPYKGSLPIQLVIEGGDRFISVMGLQPDSVKGTIQEFKPKVSNSPE